MTLHLLRYNNYYNRIIKRLDTIAEYEDYTLESFSNINFNPNDGITTEQIINYNGAIPDYVIVTSDNEIVSRWFVIEAVRTRAQQFKLDLYRDTVADYLDIIKTAPMFVEKATLNVGNPLIYNEESAMTNQIKKTENLLYDETGCPWIVGYMAPDTSGFSVPFDTTIEADITLNSLSDWEFYQYSDRGDSLAVSSIDSFRAHAYFQYSDDEIAQLSIGDLPSTPFSTINKDTVTNAYEIWTEAAVNTSLTWNQQSDPNIAIYYTNRAFNTTHKNTALQQLPAYINATRISDSVNNYNDKVIYETSTGKSYKISVRYGSVRGEKVLIESGNLFNTLTAALNDGCAQAGSAFPQEGYFYTGTPNDNSFAVVYDYTGYIITFTLVSNAKYHVDISSNRLELIDAPYVMFCMPYSDTIGIKLSNEQTITSEREVNLKAAISIATAGSSRVYDIQLVPYCPIQGLYTNGVFDASKLDKDIIYKAFEGSGSPTSIAVGAVIYCTYSKFSFNIPYKITVPDNNIDFKVANQCDMYRLCSPNYSGVFEFKATTNNGVEYFNVDCTYKPYSPYIHLNPNFGGLYGQDFDDARGLVCGGEFSLPIMSDAWANYELQNKNYQKSFDRQIENMEVQHKYQRKSEEIQRTAGALTGAAAGAMLGAQAGGAAGPWGALAGGVVGATAGGAISYWAGSKDIEINDALRAEALDYTRDQFALNLDNIKALPNSLSRVSAFTNNNKLIPFIEYYSCTDTEKEAFKNKMKYNGMTVGAIGTIDEYLQPYETYIKGQLIRLEDIEDDFHIVKTIANELYKGVFI